MTKNTETHTDWEDQLKGVLLLTREEPIEVIFSGGVSKTVSVIPWNTFVLAMDKLLADARREVIEKVREIGRYKTEAGTYSEAELDKSLAIEFGYNRAIDDVLATLKEGGGEK